MLQDLRYEYVFPANQFPDYIHIYSNSSLKSSSFIKMRGGQKEYIYTQTATPMKTLNSLMFYKREKKKGKTEKKERKNLQQFLISSLSMLINILL